MSEIPATPPSPGVGARRTKGPKTLPKLPLSAFSPPNSGVSESFPLPGSPSTIHPHRVIDGSIIGSNVEEWINEIEKNDNLKKKVKGVVVKAEADKVYDLSSKLSGSGISVLTTQSPFSLSDSTPPSSKYLYTAYTSASKSEVAIACLAAALKSGAVVDIDVQADLTTAEKDWEIFEELLTKATADPDTNAGKLIISNILPPPHDLSLPIVKLLSHTSYRSYQSQIANLSLFPNMCLKFLPPAWNAPTPPTPGREILGRAEGSTEEGPEAKEGKEKKEWKRRIKMYLGPAVEAFGFQRIIFGSAPSASSAFASKSNAVDWYEIARESFAELGVEQEDVDNVFGGNAERVFGGKS